MWSEDITGSETYAKALQKTGILTDKETKEICEGLEKVRAEWAAGEFKVVVSQGSISFLNLSCSSASSFVRFCDRLLCFNAGVRFTMGAYRELSSICQNVHPQHHMSPCSCKLFS